jgi:hypothetical protein
MLYYLNRSKVMMVDRLTTAMGLGFMQPDLKTSGQWLFGRR